MRRRTLLGLVGTTGAGALAGCSGVLGSGGGEPTVADTTFNATTASCAADDVRTATVTFDDDSAAVVANGAIQVPDTCWAGTLDGATVTESTLTVIVDSYATSDAGGACFDCDPGVGYSAHVDLDGSLPDRVLVQHGANDGYGQATVVADVERE